MTTEYPATASPPIAMKIILALLVLAGCGYGAYTHLQEQEKRIAMAEQARQAAEVKKRETLAAVDEMNRKVQETIDKFEAVKAKAFEQLKADIAADFATQKAALESERQQLQGASPTAIKDRAAQIEAEITELNKAIAKADQLNTTLLGYVRAEESKTKIIAPFRDNFRTRNQINAYNY